MKDEMKDAEREAFEALLVDVFPITHSMTDAVSKRVQAYMFIAWQASAKHKRLSPDTQLSGNSGELPGTTAPVRDASPEIRPDTSFGTVPVRPMRFFDAASGGEVKLPPLPAPKLGGRYGSFSQDHMQDYARAAIELNTTENPGDLVDDLLTFVRRLVHALHKAAPTHHLSSTAMDYLERKGFNKGPYRDVNAAPTQSTQQPDADKDRLLAALERAVAAEDALRALTDECDNDAIPGWEDRMQACIERAKLILEPQAVPVIRESRITEPSGNPGELPQVAQLECNACDWMGSELDCVRCGSVGPLCPDCRETTNEVSQVSQSDERAALERNTDKDRLSFHIWALVRGLDITSNDSCGYLNAATNRAWMRWNPPIDELSRQPSAGDAEDSERWRELATRADATKASEWERLLETLGLSDPDETCSITAVIDTALAAKETK